MGAVALRRYSPREAVPEETALQAADGQRLAATVRDVRDARLAVVLAPATSVRRTFYGAFADFLAEQDVASVAFDVRGIGDSVPAPKGARMSDWGRLDLDAALAFARKRWPGATVAVVGHSAGGQLVGLAATLPDAVVGVAAQSGWWRHWSGLGSLRMLATMHALIPAFATTLGHVPGWTGLGHDLPGGVAREWARWCRHPDYLFRDESDARRALYARYRGPLLALSFEGDDYGPAAAIDAFASFYPNARVERCHVGGDLGHFGFFRPKARAEWERVLAWLEAEALGSKTPPGDEETKRRSREA